MIFGEILHLSSETGTITFIAVLLFFLVFEGALHVAEVSCYKHGYNGLIKKLYREFMIMGFISFAIFIAAESTDFAVNDWFLSFEFAHIVVLFIGITFFLQAVVLVTLISSRNKTLLRHDNSTSEQLLIEYIDCQKQGGIKRYLFNNGPVSIPIPELREKIEYKIIQEFFIRNYNLPVEFKFANYMCSVLKEYTISLVEVRPINWLLVAVLVALNFGRLKAVDYIYQQDVCSRYPDRHYDAGGGHRRLAGDDHPDDHYSPATYYSASDHYYNGTDDDHHDDHAAADHSHICQEYTLRFVFIGSMMLLLLMFGVLCASEVYIQRLMAKVLDQEETLLWYEEAEKEEMEKAAANTSTPFASADAGVGGDVLTIDKSFATSEATKRRSEQLEALDIHPAAGAERGGISSGDIEMQILYNETAPATEEAAGRGRKKTNSGSWIEGEDGEDVDAPSNRRYLYLRCLERIMNVEYTQVADNARRSSISSEDGKMKPRVSATHAKYATNFRTVPNFERMKSEIHAAVTHSHASDTATHSGSAAAGHTAAEHPLPHGPPVHRPSAGRKSFESDGKPDMRSNFERMQSLRETLQQAREAKHPHSPMQRRGSHIFTRRNSDNRGSYSTPEAESPNPHSHTATAEHLSTGHHRGDLGSIPASEQQPKESAIRRMTRHVSRRGSGAMAQFFGAGSPLKQTHSDKTSHAPSTSTRERAYTNKFFETMRSSDELLHHRESACWHTTKQYLHAVWVPIRTFLKKLKYAIIGHHLGHEHDEAKKSPDLVKLQENLSQIFLWGSSELYYLTIEMVILLQCLYIALWATNFVLIASQSYHPVLWQIALVVPLPINFFMMKQIIFTSCILKSIVSFDKQVADRICEEAADERIVTQKMRKIMRGALKDMDISRDEWFEHLEMQFYMYVIPETAVGLTERNFKLFLHSIHVFLTDKSVSSIMRVIDFDKDGMITWEDLWNIVFPEKRRRKVLKVNKRASTRYQHRYSFDYELDETVVREEDNRRGSAVVTGAGGGSGVKRGSFLGIFGKRDSATAQTHRAEILHAQHHVPHPIPESPSERLSRAGGGGSSKRMSLPPNSNTVTFHSVDTADSEDVDTSTPHELLQRPDEEPIYVAKHKPFQSFHESDENYYKGSFRIPNTSHHNDDNEEVEEEGVVQSSRPFGGFANAASEEKEQAEEDHEESKENAHTAAEGRKRNKERLNPADLKLAQEIDILYEEQEERQRASDDERDSSDDSSSSESSDGEGDDGGKQRRSRHNSSFRIISNIVHAEQKASQIGSFREDDSAGKRSPHNGSFRESSQPGSQGSSIPGSPKADSPTPLLAHRHHQQHAPQHPRKLPAPMQFDVRDI